MQNSKTGLTGATLVRKVIAAVVATMMVATMLPLYALATEPETATGEGAPELNSTLAIPSETTEGSEAEDISGEQGESLDPATSNSDAGLTDGETVEPTEETPSNAD